MSDGQIWMLICGGFLLAFGWLGFVAWLRVHEWRARAEDRRSRLTLIGKSGGLGGGMLGGSDEADATRERMIDERTAKAAEVQRGRRGAL